MSYLRLPFILINSDTSSRIILWWEYLSWLKCNYFFKCFGKWSSLKLSVKLVRDRAGNVVRRASVSQVDILTLQRPAARADVLEAQTTELKWFKVAPIGPEWLLLLRGRGAPHAIQAGGHCCSVTWLQSGHITGRKLLRFAFC